MAAQSGSGSAVGFPRVDSGGAFGNGSTEPISAVGIEGDEDDDAGAAGEGAAEDGRLEFAAASRGGGTDTSWSFGRSPCWALNLPSESSSVSIA
jgi:hypothetical protein